MAKLSQSTRMGAFKCNLGDDVLAVTRFEGTEGVSELFEYRIDAVSEQHNIDFDKVLGTSCTLSIASRHKGVKRHFNGILTEAKWIGRDIGERGETLSAYRLVLRPWLWLLTRTTNCKLYHNKSALEVIEDTLRRHSSLHFETSASATPQLEYCVQYNESDFDFVSRLMEEYGIYYCFKHTDGDHKLLLVDRNTSLPDKDGGTALEYHETDLHAQTTGDALNSFIAGRRFRSGKVKLQDYDYENPSADLMAEKEAGESYENGKLMLYNYPGRYVKKGNGDLLANVRLEAEQSLDRVMTGEGDAATCCAGHIVKLDGHEDLDGEYMVLRASHMFRGNAYRSASGGGGEYSGYYEFRKKDLPFRSPLRTARPMIYGPQTARVVEEVDYQGRIKVRFHWDPDKDSSRAVRISQTWASKQWGDVKLPHLDMEVIVEFLNGDPDYPIVTGCVYNGDNEYPYPLPNDKSISGTKTENNNEFIMDDRSGGELIRMRAQRDVETETVNDKKETIGNEWKVDSVKLIKFTVGQSTFEMSPTEIKLSSPTIKLEAVGMLDMKASGMAKLDGGGTTIIKGGVVMIN